MNYYISCAASSSSVSQPVKKQKGCHVTINVTDNSKIGNVEVNYNVENDSSSDDEKYQS